MGEVIVNPKSNVFKKYKEVIYVNPYLMTPPAALYQDYLVSYYKMQNNVQDSWGINHGTATAITYEAGTVGQRSVFDGITSRIICTNNTNIKLSTGSVVAIVKASNAGSSYRAIVAKQYAYGLFLNDGVLSTYSWGSTTEITSGGRSTEINLNDGLNHIVILTFDLDVVNGTKIYLDGNLVLTTSVASFHQNTHLVIGAGTSGAIIQQINAQIDEVSIFNKVLTAGEVSEINAKLNSGQSLI